MHFFEDKEQEFHEKVRDGFLALQRSEPERIKKIDASLSIEEIHQQVIVFIE